MSYPSAFPDWFRSLVGTVVIFLIIAGIMGLVSLLTGCATWHHPFKDEAAFHMDAYDCDVQAAPVQDPMRAMMMKDRCMRLKGWRQ